MHTHTKSQRWCADMHKKFTHQAACLWGFFRILIASDFWYFFHSYTFLRKFCLHPISSSISQPPCWEIFKLYFNRSSLLNRGGMMIPWRKIQAFTVCLFLCEKIKKETDRRPVFESTWMNFFLSSVQGSGVYCARGRGALRPVRWDCTETEGAVLAGICTRPWWVILTLHYVNACMHMYTHGCPCIHW